MGQHSGIQWCDSTVNPTSGCVGCELARPSLSESDRVCWAYQLHTNRLSKSFAESHPHLYSPNFFEVRQIPGRMQTAARWSNLRGIERAGKSWIPAHYPRLIFLSDMADLLSPQIPFEYIRDEVLAAVSSPQGSRHIWLWLTKQAKRLVEFSEWMQQRHIEWPVNLWPGVSVTSANTEWRVDYLMRVLSAHHFVSYEPAYEWVDFFARELVPDWIIVGGASGRNPKPFDVEIVERLIAGGKTHGAAIFAKQLGAKPFRHMPAIPDVMPAADVAILVSDSHGGDWLEWPDSRMRVREFPEVAHA